MAGSLDDNPPKLYGANEYDFMVLGDAAGIAKVYVSRESRMSRDKIAEKLRRVADYVDGGNCECGDDA